jgi:mannose-6-phosphate isomerase-like protein (cupin superfamily)
MANLMEGLTLIRKAQKTIDLLLKEKEILIRDKTKVEDLGKHWTIKTIVQNEDCTMGFAYCDDPNANEFPDHIHEESIEYLICVRGSFMECFNAIGVRVVRPGECVSIPKGVIHRSKALEPNTVLAWVCVPSDKKIFDLETKLSGGDT